MTKPLKQLVGRFLGWLSLILWLSLWLMLIAPPFRRFFGHHAVPQIGLQLGLSTVFGGVAGVLHSKHWWWISAVALASLVILIVGVYSA